MHRFKNMVSHRSVGTVLSAFFDGTCHIGNANTRDCYRYSRVLIGYLPIPRQRGAVLQFRRSHSDLVRARCLTAIDFDIWQRCTAIVSKLVMSVAISAAVENQARLQYVLAFPL